MPVVTPILQEQSGQNCLEFVFNENEVTKRTDFFLNLLHSLVEKGSLKCLK